MKPVTERDVARLLDGRIDDPHEIERIVEAIERDPGLAAVADLLSDPVAPEGHEVPQTEPAPFSFPDLSRTRLCRLRPLPELQQVADSTACTAEVEYERGGQIDVFPLRLQPEGDLIRVQAEWPDGLRPIGFVLGQFDLSRGRTPYRNVRFQLPKRKIQPQSEGADRVGQTRSYSAAAASGDCRTGSDPSVNSRDFHADLQEGNLLVRGRLKGRDTDIVMAEMSYHRIGGQERTIRVPVRLERESGDTAKVQVTDFPWPDDAASDEARLTVRPLTVEDLPRLPGAEVSALLAAYHCEFVPLPVLPDDDGRLRARLLDPAQVAAIRDDGTAWFLEMAEGGGK